jgi:hypothetical protein
LAAEISQADFANAGYGDIGQLFAEMSPEQQREVMAQAKLKQHDLEQMSPQQLAELNDQMLAIVSTMNIDQVDPAKLDPKQSKNTAAIRKDFSAYQTKYEQKQLKNAILK